MPSAATLNTALCDICRGGLRSPRPGPKWAAHYVSSLVRRLCLRTKARVRRVSQRGPRNLVPGPNGLLTM